MRYKSLFFLLMLSFNTITSMVSAELDQREKEKNEEHQQSLILEHETLYISMGFSCLTALQLRMNGLRKASFPFDWIVSSSFEGFVNLLNDNFKFFLDPKFLFFQTAVINNQYYNIQFVHDFPIITHGESHINVIPNWSDYLIEVKAKYLRRIKRFNNLSKHQGKVFFIRAVSNQNLVKEHIHILKMSLKNKFPNLNFELVLISDDENCIIPLNIPQVRIFYIRELIIGSAYTNEKFAEVLKNLK